MSSYIQIFRVRAKSGDQTLINKGSPLSAVTVDLHVKISLLVISSHCFSFVLSPPPQGAYSTAPPHILDSASFSFVRHMFLLKFHEISDSFHEIFLVFVT